MDAALLRTADRHLRRKYGTYVGGLLTAADITGLTAFIDGLATKAKAGAVTINSQGFGETHNSGDITMPREVWLAAGEDLLADPAFNVNAPAPAPRIIYPDYRCNQSV